MSLAKLANVSPFSCPGLAEGEVRTLAHLCPMHVLEHEALEHKCERQEHCIKTKDRDLAARHDAEVALRAEIGALAEGRLAFESRIAGAMTMLSMSQKEMMEWQETALMGAEELDAAADSRLHLFKTATALGYKLRSSQEHNTQLRLQLQGLEHQVKALAEEKKHLVKPPAPVRLRAIASQTDARLVEKVVTVYAPAPAPDVGGDWAVSQHHHPPQGDLSATHAPRGDDESLLAVGKGDGNSKTATLGFSATLDEMHAILERKAAADHAFFASEQGATATGLAALVNRHMPRFVEAFMAKKHGSDRAARTKTRVFATSVLKWERTKGIGRLYAFAIAAGLMHTDAWSPAASDLTVGLFAECCAKRADGRGLADFLGQNTILCAVEKRTFVDALTLAAPRAAAASAFLGANVAVAPPPVPAQCLHALSTPQQLAKLFAALDRIPHDERTAGGEPFVDFEFALRLVLDYQISRARAVVRALEKAFSPLCAAAARDAAAGDNAGDTNGTLTFAQFAEACEAHKLAWRGPAGEHLYDHARVVSGAANASASANANNGGGLARASLSTRQRTKKETYLHRIAVWKHLNVEKLNADDDRRGARQAGGQRSSSNRGQPKRSSTSNLAKKKLDAASHSELETFALHLDAPKLARACFVNHLLPENPPENDANDQAAIDTVLSALAFAT